MAVVNVITGTNSLLHPRVTDYAVVTGTTAVYLDDRKNFSKIGLFGGSPLSLASNAPTAGFSYLTTDRSGNVWFSMAAPKSVGLGRIAPDAGTIVVYPFPRVEPQGGGAIACPAPSLQCDASAMPFDPGIQSIVIDGNNDVWVVTSVPGAGGDPDFNAPASSLYELPAGS
jgi:streptogramin lyase